MFLSVRALVGRSKDTHLVTCSHWATGARAYYLYSLKWMMKCQSDIAHLTAQTCNFGRSNRFSETILLVVSMEVILVLALLSHTDRTWDLNLMKISSIILSTPASGLYKEF